MTSGAPRILSIAEQSAHFLTREHAGLPGSAVDNAAAWRGSDWAGDERWVEELTHDMLQIFERAMETTRRSGRALDTLSGGDFPLEELSGTINRWRRTLTHGRGFLVLRGVPVERWDGDAQRLFMRALGLQFGRLGYQNPQGDVIGEVKDTGAAKRDPFARLYATSGEFRFHCDASDLVGLLCVRPAARGGESKIASSVSVYNEVLRRRPDLAPLLFEPMAFDLRNEQSPGSPAFAEIAPCAYADGVLKTFYISDYFRSVERLGVAMPKPRRELLDLFDEIAGEPGVGLSFYLRPGDVQVLYNHTTLHARSAFEDEPGRERLLLRFLVSIGA